MNYQAEKEKIISRIFEKQDKNGFWKLIDSKHKHYPDYLHYVPTYKGSLWTLILLADLGLDPKDPRINNPLKEVQDHLFDEENGIWSLKEDHFPIPCLNGNMVYLDCYFNGFPSQKSLKALKFFATNQRFDDGEYLEEPNQYCSNKSCFGKHTCYWGPVKLLKGISFIPKKYRSHEIEILLQKCINFVLLHQVNYSSRKADKIMIPRIDSLTFPNMYKSDFLEILWLLKRENVQSEKLKKSIELLRSKQNPDGSWNLERKMNNLITSIGPLNKANPFVSKRAEEILNYYTQKKAQIV